MDIPNFREYNPEATCNNCINYRLKMAPNPHNYCYKYECKIPVENVSSRVMAKYTCDGCQPYTEDGD